MTGSHTESDPSPTLAPSADTKLLPTDEFSQYLLHSPGEMAPIFRSLAERVSQITLIFNDGRDILLSSLIKVGANGLLWFEHGADAEMNRRALQAEKLFCVSQLDKVKIQFILQGVSAIKVDGQPAFQAMMPENMLRLQRRESYRLSTPIVQPLKCHIRFLSVDGKDYLVAADVANISIGGICLVGLPLSLPLETEMEIPGCSIELPDVGSITSTLRVRNLMETASSAGLRSQRIGCEFVRLPGAMATLVQRYVIKIERDRKMRGIGPA